MEWVAGGSWRLPEEDCGLSVGLGGGWRFPDLFLLVFEYMGMFVILGGGWRRLVEWVA